MPKTTIVQALIIEAGPHTPSVMLDPATGQFEISGKSLPEDVIEFWTPVLQWLDAYRDAPNPESEFVFRLEYFNTGSSKMLLDVMLRLQAMQGEGHEVSIVWYHLEEDEAMQEAGEEYSEIVDIPFDVRSMD